MKAKVGDWLVMKGSTIGERGLITGVHSDDGSPPYEVRWLESDHIATVFPGPNATIVTAEEQHAADEQARRRIALVQAGITRHLSST